MPFEVFKRQRAPVTTEAAVTIQKRGTMSFNAPAYEALGLPKAVELLYDREDRVMGLRKVDPSADHAYKIRPLGKGNTTWLLSGTAFTAYYGIPTDVARRWTGEVNEDGVLVLDLKQPGTEVAANRNRERSGSAA